MLPDIVQHLKRKKKKQTKKHNFDLSNLLFVVVIIDVLFLNTVVIDNIQLVSFLPQTNE